MNNDVSVFHPKLGNGKIVEIILDCPDIVIFVKWDIGLFGYCFPDELEFLLT